MRKIVLITPLLCLLAGCIGPKHKTPEHVMPTNFNQLCNTNNAQPPTAWWEQFEDQTLTELIATAVESNYDLAIARERIEEARARYQFKRAQLFPQASMVADVARRKLNPAIFPPAGNRDEGAVDCIDDRTTFFRWGFDGLWEIDFWGKIWYAKKAQYYAMQAQIEQMRDLYLILVAEVASTYIAWCSLSTQLQLQQQLLEINHALLKLTHQLFLSGLESQIAQEQARQVYESSRDQLTSITTSRTQTKHQLAVLLGKNPESLDLPDTISSIPLSHVPLATGLPSDLLRRRPDIRQAERELASSNALVGQAKAQWFPSFILLGDVGHASNGGTNFLTNSSLSWSIGPGIRWPILSFGRIRAQVHVQQSQKRQAILQYSNVIIQALKEVEDFLVGYLQAEGARTAVASIVNAARTNVTLLEAKFSSGLASKLELLGQQQNYIQEQIKLALREELVSTQLVSLYKALGGGW